MYMRQNCDAAVAAPLNTRTFVLQQNQRLNAICTEETVAPACIITC